MSENSTEPSDKLPHFDNNLRAQIDEITFKVCGAQILEEEWRSLRRHLLNYKKAHDDWDGYLKKGQISKLNRVQKSAEKLLAEITRVSNSELAWALDIGDPLHSIDSLVEQLIALARMDPKSPYAEEKSKKQRGWASHEEELRGKLQIEIDAWWLNVTGTCPKVQDSSTDYSNFLEYVFSALPPETDFGHSRAAVEKRKRDTVKNYLKIAEIGKEFMKRYGNLKPTE